MENTNPTPDQNQKLLDTNKQHYHPNINRFLALITFICVLLTFISISTISSLRNEYTACKEAEQKKLEEKILSIEKEIADLNTTKVNPPINIPKISPTNTPTTPITEINWLNCIPGEVQQLPENFPIGMTFSNMIMSGERGTFNSDGSISLKWNLDYISSGDTRPNSGVGKWFYDEGVLLLTNTSISDETYSNMRIFKQNNQYFVIPEKYINIIIGPSENDINLFFNKNIKPMYSIPNINEKICKELRTNQK